MTEAKNNKALFGIFATVFVFFFILIGFAFYTINSLNDASFMDKKEGKAHIGVIEVEGVIMDAKNTVELLQEAEEDKQIKAIILRVNSPGGAVGPTQEIYEEIIRIDRKKPIYTSFGAIAASGGYYIASATREIWSTPGTLTGSIGVIMDFMDLSKLYEFAKVSPQTIKAGKYKDAGSPSRSLTEEEKQMMEQLMAGVHTQFKNDILRRRQGRIRGDINAIAQGQIYSGEVALNIGLVDHLGSLWTAGREIHKKLHLSDEFALKFIKKKKNTSLLEVLGSLEEGISKFNPATMAETGKSPVLMFR